MLFEVERRKPVLPLTKKRKRRIHPFFAPVEGTLSVGKDSHTLSRFGERTFAGGSSAVA